MSKTTTLVAASATAVLSIITPGAAHSDPTFPLAPKCLAYQWIGDFAVRQANGWSVEFFAKGQDFRGEAVSTHPGIAPLRGPVGGTINGTSVWFEAKWNNGSIGTYGGRVDDNGFVHGYAQDTSVNGGPTTSFDSTVPLGCAAEAAPAPQQPSPTPTPKPLPSPKPPPNQPPPAPANTRTVSADVDVYDVAGGDGNKIGVLDGGEGQTVKLGSGCRADNWCNIVYPAGPGGTGWVWGDFLK